jgi:hypothetical protein
MPYLAPRARDTLGKIARRLHSRAAKRTKLDLEECVVAKKSVATNKRRCEGGEEGQIKVIHKLI